MVFIPTYPLAVLLVELVRLDLKSTHVEILSCIRKEVFLVCRHCYPMINIMKRVLHAR